VPTSFPTSLDTFPSAATLAAGTLGTVPHSTLHGDLGSALAAVEAKVGVDGSGVTTSLDYKVAALQSANLQVGGVYQLPLSYTTTTSVTVGPGYARDSADSKTIHLTTAGTISTATLGGINGLDRTAISGTVATNTANATVTGSGTTFTTAFTNRTGSGTITGAGTTITGTGTAFLSEVKVGDLIGTVAKGFARVTAVASDTSLTLAVAIPGGSPAGTTPVVIENAWLQVNAQTVQQINSITSDTVLTLAANSSATVASGGTCYIGALPSGQTYLMVWVGTGGTGTGVWLSTQRTTPFGITGYATNYRRIGSVMWTGSVFIEFDQYGQGVERWYQFECARNTDATRILAAGTATTWTDVVASGAVPATAAWLYLSPQVSYASNSAVSFRKRNSGNATTNRALLLLNTASNNFVGGLIQCACDGAGAIQYVNESSGGSTYIDVAGYGESL
jgi:hypothetical protein